MFAMPTNEKPSLDIIRKEIQTTREVFRTGSSSYASRIDNALADFDDFAVSYRALWEELLGKISRSQQDSKPIELVDIRIADLWSALRDIVNQYEDQPYKTKVEEGMKFLGDLCKKNAELFPDSQADPDVLIFIKKQEINVARKYPFTNTFFIGISDSSVNLKNTPEGHDDWRPVAHELGHYLYWNSCFHTMAGSNIRARIDQDPVFARDIENTLKSLSAPSLPNASAKMALTDLITSWSEEIFADLVGTRLLGREYVDSSQDLFQKEQENHSGNRFTRDIDHPIPYLRPFVCAEGLKLVEGRRNLIWFKFKNLFESAFEDTQKLFVGWLSKDSNESQFSEFQLDVPTMQDAIKPIIPVIYEKLETKEPIIGQPIGIDVIKERMETAFLSSYLEISEELERGDLPGLVRRLKEGAGKVITTIAGG